MPCTSRWPFRTLRLFFYKTKINREKQKSWQSTDSLWTISLPASCLHLLDQKNHCNIIVVLKWNGLRSKKEKKKCFFVSASLKFPKFMVARGHMLKMSFITGLCLPACLPACLPEFSILVGKKSCSSSWRFRAVFERTQAAKKCCREETACFFQDDTYFPSDPKRKTCLLQLVPINDSRYARRTLSQFWSFKIRRTTFLNYLKFANLLITRLSNCERVRQVEI